MQTLHVVLIRLQASLNRTASASVNKMPDVITAMVVLGISWLLALAIPRALRRGLRRTHIPQDAAHGIEKVAYFVILFLGIFATLDELDISLGALGIEVSILGVAIGFALKDLLTNMVSGWLILSTRPFSVGDQIRIKDFEGTVSIIGLRGVTLATYDGRHVIIPNIDVFTNPVVNNTASPLRRHSVRIGVSPTADLALTRKIILDALRQIADVAQDPLPEVLVTQVADFDIRLEIQIWTAALQSEVQRINSEATQAIFNALLANHVEIPLPTQVVNIVVSPDKD